MGGSAIGGGTFRGLSQLVTDYRSFEATVEAAEGADAAKVNLLVPRSGECGQNRRCEKEKPL